MYDERIVCTYAYVFVCVCVCYFIKSIFVQVGDTQGVIVIIKENGLGHPSSNSPLWPGVVPPGKFLSIGQIEQTVCKQMSDVELWLLNRNTWSHLTVCKKELRLI